MKTETSKQADMDVRIAADSGREPADMLAKNPNAAVARRGARLHTPSSLGAEATRDIAGALNALLADFFALYLKTKNFHWHVSGPPFRRSHLLLHEQADPLDATPDPIR